MENEDKVFCSNITRADGQQKNNLYDLLSIIPAKPLSIQRNKNETCDFTPNCDKYYIPKKGSKLKVKTVRDIRNYFEQDLYSYLTDDIEKQQNYLLRKIRSGSSRDENTIKIAKNVLDGQNPISRSTWQMLININPEKHNHSKQFVLWNGKRIQLNGSKGGKQKFICNYDVANITKMRLTNTSCIKKNILKTKKGILRSSLNIKFKPGPLRLKKNLDESHHKYHMGQIELITLPKPALDILPAYGIVLEPTISNFVNTLRGETGVISQKWAEFAVSVLGTVRNKSPMQLDKECCITFNLNYKSDQNRLLMRRYIDDTATFINIDSNCHENPQHFNNESLITIEVEKVMDDMLSCVEISLQQDNMHFAYDEPRLSMQEVSADVNGNTKDKYKRKYGELDRLDVTIIKLPESYQKEYTKKCGKSFCTLGCICESLDCGYNFKQHCGLIDCMFRCKCELSKYKDIGLLERDCTEIMPGLLKLDNEINSRLAKEEQKFHQTVIMSGEKSILLKSQKRNWKASRKYADFYSNMTLKNDEKNKKILTVAVFKLPCPNIEPWCMVHQLYKCFCKGKFTDSSMSYVTEASTAKILNIENTKLESEIRVDNIDNVKSIIRPRLRPEKIINIPHSESIDSKEICSENEEPSSSCARIMRFNGRKYSDEYYKNTNHKILEMEKNDNILRKKMLKLINGSESDVAPNVDSLISVAETSNESINDCEGSETLSNPFSTASRGKCNLEAWLEFSYKSYKERLEKGFVKTGLDAPKKGKASLQTWEFILNRYRERKNIYFVSKQKPYRIYLAVDEKHPFFTNCINIDEIRFADLPKYPLIIRNLLTNATDVKNNFCILRGWDHCWELIGSAVKVIEQNDNLLTQGDSSVNENDDSSEQEKIFSHHEDLLQDEKEPDISDRSKWFLMTVENDFTEIQFYKRGFYVTYEGIQRSICLARISGKTVRLSSQVCADKNSAPQFGIYAIPSTSECCVFIGPYEVDESLGVEVVKTILDSRKQRKTRGVWITTNKIDNMKVIDNPLSFIPSNNIPNESMVTLDSSNSTNVLPSLTRNDNKKATNCQIEQGNILDKSTGQEIPKIVKPIKIRRTNGFYHLSSNKIMQKISSNKSSLLINKPSTPNTIVMKSLLSNVKSNDLNMSNYLEKPRPVMAYLKPIAEIAPQKTGNQEESSPSTSMAYLKPVAEIAPQIKITSVYSESKLDKMKVPGMHILKPDEINKKVFATSYENVTTSEPNVNDEMSLDIENYLATSQICKAPHEEIFVISDCEEEENKIIWKEVWIQCSNVANFGWIRGKSKDKNLLSFEFPGFKYSEFYKTSEAFDKLNQVLARKIYVPKNIKLEWEVIQSEKDLKSDILTSERLVKKYLFMLLKKRRSSDESVHRKASALRTYSRNKKGENPSTSTACDAEDESGKAINKDTIELIEDLEVASRELEDEGMQLWNNLLKVSGDQKSEMAKNLQGLRSLNKS